MTQLIRDVPPETISLLRRLHRSSVHHVVRQRAHCLLLNDQGWKQKELSEILGVSLKTVSNWFRAWEDRGLLGLYDRVGRGRKSKLTDEQKEQVRQWANEHPKQLKKIIQKVKESWGIEVSKDTLRRVLKSLGMSWRRFRRGLAGKPNAQDYQEKKAELEKLKQLDEQGELELYYADESGFCLVPTVPYGWQEKGQRQELPSTRSKRLNVLSFMTRRSEAHSYVSEQSITSSVVLSCIDSFFPQPEKRTVIVMDQATIHTSGEIQDQLERWKDRQIEIFWLPTYSPHLNCIERLWQFMKYEWIEVDAYDCWKSLNQYVDSVLANLGSTYVINFA